VLTGQLPRGLAGLLAGKTGQAFKVIYDGELRFVSEQMADRAELGTLPANEMLEPADVPTVLTDLLRQPKTEARGLPSPPSASYWIGRTRYSSVTEMVLVWPGQVPGVPRPQTPRGYEATGG